MTNNAQSLQDQLDQTTGAQVSEKYTFPMYARSGSSQYLILAENKELVLSTWSKYFKATGLERLEKGDAEELPPMEIIEEIERIIIELKSKL